MEDATYLKAPGACSSEERAAFERLVREGFDGSDDGLPGRIHGASQLAFHYAPADSLVAIAALKAPGARYRERVFAEAGIGASPSEYELELGWVYVVAAHRGRGLGKDLCRQLLAQVESAPVFATTCPDNVGMVRTLSGLGFSRAGQPYIRRNQELAVFLRSTEIGKGC